MAYSNVPVKGKFYACLDGGALDTQRLVFNDLHTFLAQSCIHISWEESLYVPAFLYNDHVFCHLRVAAISDFGSDLKNRKE
jgi:hypothetical protein